MKVPATMQALQLRQVAEVNLVELPVPRPAADESLVKTVATTICTSDLLDIAENPFGGRLPRILGHEGAGIVTAKGEHVEGLAIGQRIGAHPVIPCKDCENCQRGLGHLCLNMGHLGLDRGGTFAEFFCIRADRVRPVPEGTDMATAALFEPVANCMEAIRRAGLQAGETVLIVGDGPFGIITALLSAGCQPKNVLLAGHHDFRMRFVPEAVPIHTGHIEDPLKAVFENTAGSGVDVAVLCVASQAAIDLCVRSLRARGRLVVFSSITAPATIDFVRILLKELAILGSCNDEDLFDEAVAFVATHNQRLAHLVTHHFRMEQWQQAISVASREKDHAVKVALTFGE